jgi:Pyruvate/2-oxoacid:ferredoxin oxidoreductase gamma subunit
MGITLSELGMRHNYYVSWLPSYGPEMRGGTAHCHVKIFNDRIGSPLVANPTIFVAMNKPSLEKFEKEVVKNGIVIYDSSLIDNVPQRRDISVFSVPATQLSDRLGSTKAANMVMLGVITELTHIFSPKYVHWSIPFIMKNEKYVELNQKAFQKGREYFISHFKK